MPIDHLDPLKEARQFSDAMQAGYASVAARSGPPPATPRLIEAEDGSVKTREGVPVRGPRPQKGAAQ